MKVAITGASGLLGTALLTHLRQRPQYELTAFSRMPRASNDVRWIAGDLANFQDCQKVVRDADAVVHLAHDGWPLSSGRDLVREARESLLPTLTLVQAVRQCRTPPRFIYPSSGGAVYGATTDNRPFTEDDPCRPSTSYGIRKLTIEHYLRVAAYQNELSAVILRISNAYGQPLPPERTQGLIGTTIARIAAGLPLRIIGNPHNVRDYVHVTDICTAVEKALGHEPAFSVLNIGSGDGHSVFEVLETIERIWGRPVDRAEVTDPPAGLQAYCVLDTQRAAVCLQWKPRMSLQDGIAQMLSQVSNPR